MVRVSRFVPTWTNAVWTSGNRSWLRSCISQRFAARSVASSAEPAGSSPTTVTISRLPSGTNSEPSAWTMKKLEEKTSSGATRTTGRCRSDQCSRWR